jgi:hypothetical protein
VSLGPDRDFLEIAQFTQGVRIEFRHRLSPLIRRLLVRITGPRMLSKSLPVNCSRSLLE